MKDDEQLRLLAIFHFILGGLSALCACFPFIHLAVGIGIVSGRLPVAANGSGPPAAFGWLFIVMAGAFILAGWAYAISMVMVGRLLQQRRRYLFCLVMAAISCANVPFGTCLGVFTILALARPSVKLLFEKQTGVEFVSDFL